jgi:hypothetical protein
MSAKTVGERVDDFQAAAWPERQPRMACAATWMHIAKDRAHARTLLHRGNAPGEVVNAEDDMVETCQHRFSRH